MYWVRAEFSWFKWASLCVSLNCCNCLWGLMATMTIVARIAIAATTRRISRSVKAVVLVCLEFIKIL